MRVFVTIQHRLVAFEKSKTYMLQRIKKYCYKNSTNNIVLIINSIKIYTDWYIPDKIFNDTSKSAFKI